MSIVIDKNQPARGLLRSAGTALGTLASLLPGHLFATDNTGIVRGTRRTDHRGRPGSKLAKRVAAERLLRESGYHAARDLWIAYDTGLAQGAAA